MAKYTPTLLGQDTEINIAPFFGGGFVDAGAAQLNQAVQNNARAITEAKNKKFEQAQALRDGIVSGHFSDIMAAEVGEDIAELATMGTYSEAYQVKLAEANARLGINVAKQAQITTGAKEITDQFQQDPSNKYYERNALGASLDDAIETGGLNTSRDDLDNSFTGFKNNIDNIKDGVVRTDFQSKLGEIVQKVEETGGLSNVNSEFSKFTKTVNGQKFVTGYTYDAQNRMYVPAFDESKLPPQGLVELYRGIDDSAATLMDNYVNEKHKLNGGTGAIDPHAKKVYEQEFVLEEMKKLAPGGSIQESEDTQFRGRPQDPNRGSAANKALQLKANTVNDMVTNIDQVRNLDLSQLPGGTDSVPFAMIDTNGDGIETQMLDVTSFSKADYKLARVVTEDLQDGSINEDYVRPSKVYLSIDPNTEERTLYFEGTDQNGDPQYTVYNDRTANQVVQNMSKNTFGSQTYFDAWSYYNKSKGVMSSDGSVNRQSNLSGLTDEAKADAISRQNAAQNQAQQEPAFDAATLGQSIYNASNNSSEIDKALEPVNLHFARNGHTSVGVTDRNGAVITDKKVKYIKFKRDGEYFGNRFSKKYGILEYKVDNGDGTFGPLQTAEVKVQDFVNEISGSSGEFDLNQER